MASILLAKEFPLPESIVTESIYIGGRKGSGKTNTAGCLFEQMFGIGAQCVVLDIVGNWYGLRLSASGKRAGLKIPVFGGDHGDIPIAPTGGKLMAQTVVNRGISCVIDLMSFRPAQQKVFATDFAEELFELKKRKRTPLHLFLEEARKFIPQQQRSDLDTRMIAAFEDIVRLGRNYGFGVSLLDQRPQSVNKEVLSQTELLIVHQITEKLGRKEIEDWVRSKTVAGGEALEQLAELYTGEAFVWSPGLLRKFAKVKVLKKRTYDASRTPELGDVKQAELKPLSSKDLEGLRSEMAKTVEEAEANDPSKLRDKIRRLELEIKKRPAEVQAKTVEVERIVEVPVADPKLVERLMELEADVSKAMSPIGERVAAVTQLLARFTTDIAKQGKKALTKAASNGAPKPAPRPMLTVSPPTLMQITAKRPQHEKEDSAELTGPEKRILASLAWWNSIGITAPNDVAVAFLAGYSPGGGAYTNPRGALRSKGLLDKSGNGWALTEQGHDIAQSPDRPLTVEAMHQAVLARLPGPERRILQPLLDQYPNTVTNEDLAAAAGYEANGGAYTNPRGRLRSLGLIDYTNGKAKARPLLFLEGN